MIFFLITFFTGRLPKPTDDALSKFIVSIRVFLLYSKLVLRQTIDEFFPQIAVILPVMFTRLDGILAINQDDELLPKLETMAKLCNFLSASLVQAYAKDGPSDLGKDVSRRLGTPAALDSLHQSMERLSQQTSTHNPN